MPDDTFEFGSTEQDSGLKKNEKTPPAGSGPASAFPVDSQGNFLVLEELGAGGMGCVYAGKDLAFDRKVAIKTVLKPKHVGRFITESKITARLSHPGIPPVHALGKFSSGIPFLAMKLVQGENLTEALRKRGNRGEVAMFVQLFEQIAQTVGFAHEQGILHRDLKPDNIMVGKFGEVHVMDWGLAKEFHDPEKSTCDGESAKVPPLHTSPGGVVGTHAYMPPEQARGEQLGPPADVFALGGILTFILTGKPTYEGSSAAEMACAGDTAAALKRLALCGADGELIEIARKCLEKNPENRPANGMEVAQLVADYRAEVERRLRQAETEQAKAQTKAQEERKRRRVIKIAFVSTAVVLVLGLLGTTIGLVRTEAARRDAVKAQQAEARRALAERKAKAKAEKATELMGKAMHHLLSSTFEMPDAPLEVYLYPESLLQELVTSYSDHPDHLQFRARLAGLRLNIANRLGKEESEKAERLYLLVKAEFEELLKQEPDKEEHVFALGKTSMNLGVLWKTQGKTHEAMRQYENAIEIFRKLSKRSPLVQEFSLRLAQALNNSAILDWKLGQRQEAERKYREAHEIKLSLVRQDPANLEYKKSLAVSYERWAGFASVTNQNEQAVVLAREAIEFIESLIETHPELTNQLKLNLVACHHYWADAAEALGRPEQARELRQKANAIAM